MTADWNILLYAIAKDDAEHKRISDAVTDIHTALTTNQCNVAVQVHTRSRTQRYWISRGSKLHETLPVHVDASQPASLTSFINTANRRFPARSSALVLWAHSSGLDNVHDSPPKKQPSLDGVFAGPDHAGLGGSDVVDAIDDVFGGGAPAGLERSFAGGNHHGDGGQPRAQQAGSRWGPDPDSREHLTNVGMKQAIAASARNRVDLLGLNACWMASIEVEYELRNVSEVQVASQVYSTPWPYGAIAAAIAARPDLTACELAKVIVDCVRAEIAAGKRNDAVSTHRSGPAMTDVATALDAYARRCMALLESDWESVLKAVMVDAQRIDDPYQVDLMSLIHELGKHDLKAKIAAATVASAYRTMLLDHAASAGHPGVHGLSIFCPKSTRVDLGDAYRGTEFRSNAWARFLTAFQIKLKRSPIT